MTSAELSGKVSGLKVGDVLAIFLSSKEVYCGCYFGCDDGVLSLSAMYGEKPLEFICQQINEIVVPNQMMLASLFDQAIQSHAIMCNIVPNSISQSFKD
tara:strand:- start:1570 stop:1866 length:297 start_codon:yes stop_codon:yes gene_type:complete